MYFRLRIERSAADQVIWGGTVTQIWYGCTYFSEFIPVFTRAMLSVVRDVPVESKAFMVISSISRSNRPNLSKACIGAGFACVCSQGRVCKRCKRLSLYWCFRKRICTLGCQKRKFCPLKILNTQIPNPEPESQACPRWQQAKHPMLRRCGSAPVCQQ